MAIIPLRAYNRDIEGMIDNGQLDEAVAHCRHILATFPKHIATYRLLGKAHLEQQRISDATDIFQRVLSAIPDDFIANVGMSIIREDENNLDASIWHMELAYEAQPSNNAIQDELRRLYGRRDGIQPPKVRLTRGALARMYAKGGLLDQAVAELRAAISEDPNRYDLQLLLASMYYQTSQRVEAIDTCVNILKKLPFCLAANQILAVSLPETEQSGTSKNYRQIAISMDPYYSFAAKDAITSDQVPENSVNIERLEWKSGIQISEVSTQPSWATSLGVSLDKKPEEALPEWLKGTEAPITPEPGEKAQPSVSPFIWDTQEVERIITEETKSEGEIPDWMKDAGWKPASVDTTQKTGEAISEQPIIDVQPQEDLEKADVPDWLRGIAPEGALEEEQPSIQPIEKDVSLPWLDKQQPGPSDSIIQWLEEAKPETPISTPEPEGISGELTEEEMPDWLKDLDVAYPTADKGEQTKEEIETSTPATSAFIEGLVIAEALKPKETKEVPSEGQLEQVDLVGQIPEISETLPTPESKEIEEVPAAFAEELPDWIKELAGEAPESSLSAIPSEGLKEELPSISEEQATIAIPSAREELPKSEPLVTAEEITPVEVPIISEEPTVSLPTIIGEPPQVEEPLAAEGETSADTSRNLGENAALAWLAGLAIQDNIEEEKQVTPQEDQTTTPELIKPGTEVISEETILEQEPLVEEAPAIPAEEIPEWLIGLGETTDIEEIAKEPVEEITPEQETPITEEIPTWILASELPLTEKEAPTATQEIVEKEEELPDWIKEIAETAPPEESTPTDLVATKELPALPSEPTLEWTSEEATIAELGEYKPIEPEVKESTWVPEVEAPIQPELSGPAEAEVEIAPSSEQPIEPVIEIPETGLTELEDARKAINQGVPAQAIEIYAELIKKNLHIEDVIKDIHEALYRFPVDVNLWVTLGDAHLQTDELEDALDAYIKAEDLVR